jgi:trimeric autotransporter adhesin
VLSDQSDNGNLLGMVSGWTKLPTASTHAMADVWFDKEDGSPPVELGDVLAAPAADLLPGGGGVASTSATTASASPGSASGWRSAYEDELLRNGPII